jgi:acyl-CoA synthetase (AMP-forming)/AMP-acid ligase II
VPRVTPAGAETVYGAFCDSAARYPHRDFLTILPDTAAKYVIEARDYSYAETMAEVEALRTRYATAGMGLGHRVGLMLENRPAFFFHWLALNALGVSVVPVSPESRSAELDYLLEHSELCVAVVPAERAAEMNRAAHAAQRRLVVTSPDLNALIETPYPAPGGSRAATIETECALLYTSGTTGRPKGCVLPNEYFLGAGLWYSQAGELCAIAPGAERLITPLPMSHMNAMAYSTMVMLLTGGCIVPLDRFHPANWWNSVRASRATIIHYLGVMPAMLLGAAPDAADRQHAVRFGFGAGVSPRLHADFESRFGFPLLEAWAMTETGAGAVIIANREPRKVGSACFGRADPRIDCRVVDDEGKDVSMGQPGELLVRAAGTTSARSGFFREYLKDPAATEEAWRGGYFHTGDIVRMDQDGDFHFVDRKKNVIRRSGENISAVEVESVLQQHPGVAEVGVTAVPDAVRGDEVMACIVPARLLDVPERAELARDVQEFCLQRLAYFKAPGYVAFCEQLPVTSTEKIQRARLKEFAQTLVGAPGCIDMRASKKRRASVG